MTKYSKTLVSCLLIVSMCLGSFSAFAATYTTTAGVESNQEQNSPAAMTVDLFLLRPLGLVATLAGSVVFVLSWPFSALGGNSAEAWDSLVVTPAEYTFKRPLGETEE